MGVMTGLLLLLWVGVAVSTPVDLQKRIIGGSDCGLDKRLYHVKLINSNVSHTSLCGGSLISHRWILTAAHCWKTERGWTMTAYLRKSPNSDELVPMQIEEHHPFVNQTKTHDIMLLKLKQRNPNPTQIKFIPLPDCRKPLKPADTDTVEVAGYGPKTMGPNNERKNQKRADVLQCVNITVEVCGSIPNCNRFSYEHLECYKSHGVDTSGGDSGGGVVFNGRIYGVHVLTFNGDYACVAPAGFMDVCEFMDWILNTTGLPRP